jgi:hypothetical protein
MEYQVVARNFQATSIPTTVNIVNHCNANLKCITGAVLFSVVAATSWLEVFGGYYGFDSNTNRILTVGLLMGIDAHVAILRHGRQQTAA